MVEKTLGRAVQPKRGQNYNFPARWYAKPNGDIVQLQSDPQSRAYYADKGFHLLADTAARGESMSEVEEWERIERPRVIAEQRRKAALIDADTIDSQSIEGLEVTIKEIRSRGTPVPDEAARERAEPEPPLLRGVESAETLEDLQRKLGAEGAQTRTIQGTGHDPIDESRRRTRGNG